MTDPNDAPAEDPKAHRQLPPAGDAAFAAEILDRQARGVSDLARSLAEPFEQAVELIDRCAESHGTVLVSGLGKSGLVGAKISATLASLGIPSHAVHPSEAAHGDLGRFRRSDTVICLSFSGETTEVVNLAAILRQDGLPIISITGPRDSTLAKLATVALQLPIDREAGEPGFVAPTTSTTATMALGDALALTVARRRSFTDQDFAKRHPGGALGGLLRPVTDVLRFRVGEQLVPIPETETVANALAIANAAASRRPGALLLVDPGSGRLTGIFTDGDLRRLVTRDPALLDQPVASLMTRTPTALPSDALVRDAVRLVREFRQDEIPVVDAEGRPVGILDVQDLITLRLVQD